MAANELCVNAIGADCVLPAPSLLGNDCVKLSDDVVANDCHVESTCDRIATLGTQMPSQVPEIQRLIDGTGLRKDQSLAPLLQPLCPCFQRFTADSYARIFGRISLFGALTPALCADATLLTK